MKTKHTRYNLKETTEFVADYNRRVDAIWEELDEIISRISLTADYETFGDDEFEYQSNIIMRLFFLSASIKTSQVEHFDLLCEIFARYLKCQHGIMDRLAKQNEVKE